ncbi:MAG: hypothetical protein PHY90_03810 [Desulfitobacteriaceae bacterium]|nr:hypothetical protein [Desulfitobacteriaceae bacterium]
MTLKVTERDLKAEIKQLTEQRVFVKILKHPGDGWRKLPEKMQLTE